MRLTMIVALGLLLSACQAPQPGCARLPGGGGYCLQSTGGLIFTTDQRSELIAGGQRLTLLTRIESDANGLRFAGMTPLGQTLFFVSWENGALRADLPPALANRIDPALLPALLQMALWPAAAVRAGLSPDLELIEENHRRRLRRKDDVADKDILDISWEGDLPYQHLRIVAPIGFSIDAHAVDSGETP